ncbi:MAG: hypothetical protein H5T71_06545, partial [Chloroflexi bacterium]|nr:hypothetical protein [Chloroflexota bacterium]
MSRNRWRLVSVLTILALLLSLIGVAPAGAAPGDQANPPQRIVPQDVKPPANRAQSLGLTEAPEVALQKIDPSLRALAQQGGKETVSIYVTATPDVDLSGYLEMMIARPVIFGGVRNVYGVAKAKALLAIAQIQGVTAIVSAEKTLRDLPYDAEREDTPNRTLAIERLNQLRANEVPYRETAAAQNDVKIQGWFDVRDGHQSSKAWEKGFK